MGKEENLTERSSINNSKPETQLKRDSIQLEIDTCQCREGNGNIKKLQKKRVSIMLSEEMMLNGYPSLLILDSEQACDPLLRPQEHVVRSALKRSDQTKEMHEDRSKLEIVQDRSIRRWENNNHGKYFHLTGRHPAHMKCWSTT